MKVILKPLARVELKWRIIKNEIPKTPNLGVLFFAKDRDFFLCFSLPRRMNEKIDQIVSFLERTMAQKADSEFFKECKFCHIKV